MAPSTNLLQSYLEMIFFSSAFNFADVCKYGSRTTLQMCVMINMFAFLYANST